LHPGCVFPPPPSLACWLSWSLPRPWRAKTPTSLCEFLSISRGVLWTDLVSSFAHYMIGEIFDEHTRKDIVDAQKVGIDGFAMNFGTILIECLSFAKY
jgi:hypothetical protein